MEKVSLVKASKTSDTVRLKNPLQLRNYFSLQYIFVLLSSFLIPEVHAATVQMLIKQFNFCAVYKLVPKFD